MSRYVRGPVRTVSRGWIEDPTFPEDAAMIPSLEVDGHECVETGLLWADGSTIMRAPNPLGFGRDGEWS
jgi:hypothetical protein